MTARRASSSGNYLKAGRFKVRLEWLFAISLRRGLAVWLSGFLARSLAAHREFGGCGDRFFCQPCGFGFGGSGASLSLASWPLSQSVFVGFAGSVWAGESRFWVGHVGAFLAGRWL